MFTKLIMLVGLVLFSVSVAIAGNVVNGVWVPSHCGSKQSEPVIDESSVDAYNKSIKEINDWQHLANDYMNCLINEANADNALIAKTANEEQAKFRAEVDDIKFKTDAAKQKLDKQ